MLIPGLISVTFRPLPCEEIIRLAAENGLRCVEWGGDVHVPPGDPANARRVGAATRAAGLEVSSYGSYYRLGTHGDAYQAAFREILLTAEALGAPLIRIWAGAAGSAETTEARRAALTAEAKALAGDARAAGLTLALECHNGTLTDRWPSAVRLLEDVGADNLLSYWQPNERLSVAENLEAEAALLPYAAHLHVFHWPSPGVRLPLADGREAWTCYLAAAAADGRDRRCMLEFMPDDDPASLPREADALHGLLSKAQTRRTGVPVSP